MTEHRYDQENVPPAGTQALAFARHILDRAHNGAVMLDEDGVVTYWNESAERIFGLAGAQALGRPVAELIIPERQRAAHREGLRRFLEEGTGPVLDRRVELSALDARGGEFPVEMTITPFKDGKRWCFHAFIQDMRELRGGERERERLVVELRNALRGSERRFDAIVGSLADAVTIRDREHRFLYANQAALEHLGFDTWEQLRSTAPESIMRDYLVYGEDGRGLQMRDIPSVRILAGEPAEPLLIRTVHRATAVERWDLLKAAPLLNEEGEVEATITIIEDVTERKRAELRSAFLAEASEALASSLDYEQTLRNVAALAVPSISDWCAVDLLTGDGQRQTVAVAHIDPERLALAERLRAYEPEQMDPEQGLGLVLRTGQPLLYPEISDEMLLAAAVDEQHLELLRAVGFSSALVVPMRLGGRILGAMTLVSAESLRVLNEFDVELAGDVGARAAVAIENARIYSERSSIARTLQQNLLPEELPAVPGYELASLYVPAVETTLVGGDFYDVWQVADGWMVIVGDVTGKGIDAAALTALVRHTMRAASEFRRSPAALLEIVDSTLKKRSTTSVCTALCMRLEGDRVTLAVGGHPPPLLLAEHEIRELDAHGPLLGAFADVCWQDFQFTLEPATTLVVYTDGITDTLSEDGVRFGLGRLFGALEPLGVSPAADVIAGLSGSLGRFQAVAHNDDTAALVVRRLAADAGCESVIASTTVGSTAANASTARTSA